MEEVEVTGVHQLVGVSVGLFDDAAGVVQVFGDGLAAGQRVWCPLMTSMPTLELESVTQT